MHDLELSLAADEYRRLWEHLTGGETAFEEAAFLFCPWNDARPAEPLVPAEIRLLPPSAFASRSAYYLELLDETRASLIKRAHDLNCCLVEFHSHPGQSDAEFSWSDLAGFEDFVPHVRWRLKGRPYIAVVCGTTSFDSLVWQGEETYPSGLATISVGAEQHCPTGNTLSHMRSGHGRRTF